MASETNISLWERLEKEVPNLPAKLEGLGRYVTANLSQVVFMTIKQLSAAAGVSDTTVTRFVGHFGFSGYPEFLAELRSLVAGRLPVGGQARPGPPLDSRLGDEFQTLAETMGRLEAEPVFRELVRLLPAAARVHILGSPAAAADTHRLYWELSRLRPEVGLADGSFWREQEALTALPEGSLVIVLIKRFSTTEMNAHLKLVNQRRLPVFIFSDGPPGALGEFNRRFLVFRPGPLDLLFPFLTGRLAGEVRDGCALLFKSYQEGLEKISLAQQPAADRRDTLQLAISHAIKGLDPTAIHGHMREGQIMRCIYQGLVRFEEGAGKVVPELATHWQESEDGASIIFYLRQDVHFHQGYGEFSAADVKYSFERAAKVSGQVSGHSAAWEVLREVEILGRSTVRLVLKHPCPHLFSGILALSPGYIVSRRAMEQMGQSQYSINPVGTGPYEIKAFKPREAIELEAYDQFWGEKPKTRRLIFRLDTHAFNFIYKFASGSLDVATFPNLNPAQFADSPDLVLHPTPGCFQFWWLGMVVNKPPFDRLEVRRAVRLALDLDHIRQTGFFNSQPLGGPIPNGVEGHWDQAPVFPYDPDQARARIAAAGIKPDYPIILAADSADIDLAALEIIKDNLAAVGFNPQLELSGRQGLLDKVRRRECHLYLYFFSSFFDPYLSLSWFVKDQYFNLSHWDCPDYDRLVAAIGRETDRRRRLEMVVEAQKLIADDCWAVWLAQGGYSIVHKNYVDIGAPLPDGFLSPWTMSKRL